MNTTQLQEVERQLQEDRPDYPEIIEIIQRLRTTPSYAEHEETIDGLLQRIEEIRGFITNAETRANFIATLRKAEQFFRDNIRQINNIRVAYQNNANEANFEVQRQAFTTLMNEQIEASKTTLRNTLLQIIQAELERINENIAAFRDNLNRKTEELNELKNTVKNLLVSLDKAKKELARIAQEVGEGLNGFDEDAKKDFETELDQYQTVKASIEHLIPVPNEELQEENKRLKAKIVKLARKRRISALGWVVLGAIVFALGGFLGWYFKPDPENIQDLRAQIEALEKQVASKVDAANMVRDSVKVLKDTVKARDETIEKLMKFPIDPPTSVQPKEIAVLEPCNSSPTVENITELKQNVIAAITSSNSNIKVSNACNNNSQNSCSSLITCSIPYVKISMRDTTVSGVSKYELTITKPNGDVVQYVINKLSGTPNYTQIQNLSIKL